MSYRFSSDFIKRWERRLVAILCIGVAIAFALAGGGILAVEGLGLEDLDTPLSWVLAGVVGLGLLIGVLAVVGVIFTASVMGGLSLHPLGWIPGLLLPLWMFGGFVLYGPLSGGAAFAVHLLGFAPVIVLFFWARNDAMRRALDAEPAD